MNLAIETDNLGKNYADVTAVEHLSLRVNEGEIYAFLGLNGAGKTTTIRMLLGMIRPTTGTARVLAAPVRHDVAVHHHHPVAAQAARQLGQRLRRQPQGLRRALLPGLFGEGARVAAGRDERKHDQGGGEGEAHSVPGLADQVGLRQLAEQLGEERDDWLLGVTSPSRSYNEKLDRLCGYKRPVVDAMSEESNSLDERSQLQASIDARSASRQPRCVGAGPARTTAR